MAVMSVEALLLWVAVLGGLAFTRLPYEELPGGRDGLIPSVFFRDQPAAFYAFVLALVLSSSAALGAIMHRRSFPGYASVCRRTAAVSLMVAIGAILWASSRSRWLLWRAESPETVADG